MFNVKVFEDSSTELGATDRERLVVVLEGSAEINGQVLGERDMIYLPRGSRVSIRSLAMSNIYIAEAPAAGQHRAYVKMYREAEEVEVGVESYRRRVRVMIGEGDPADSLLAGYTEGERGAWTSYPPHRHDEKPEVYVFYGMGRGFAVQMIFGEEFEEAYIVRDRDVVLITKGYHPNVCTSLAGCKYLWIISAPIGKRDLSVTIHPDFRDVPMGRSHVKPR